MNEYTKKKVKIVAGLLALAVCIALVVIGHNLGASGGLSTGLTAFWHCWAFIITATNKLRSV